jgi:tRNA G10  N-methylase Trm11
VKYLFILGRNPELSTAEIHSYFQARKTNFEVISGEDKLLLIDGDFDARKAIGSLGGSIAIGKILVSGEEEIKEYINSKEIYFGEENKFSYTVHDFSSSDNLEIKDLIKNKFRGERLKANLRNPELTPEKMNKLTNYFIYEDDKLHFGIMDEVYNTEEQEKRDMNKPVRREALAIPPRLAKILINLSQVKENQTLVDPFCGIGVILQEALVNGINVVGVDKDKKAIENCKKNIAWLSSKYKIKSKYKIINNDSKTVRVGRIDGIACEPNLGKLLEKSPRKDEAMKTQEYFEGLVIQVLNNLARYLRPGGKIAFTAPSIRAQGERISCNIGRIMHRTGLKMAESEIDFPIIEERDGQVVGREIYVLEQRR